MTQIFYRVNKNKIYWLYQLYPTINSKPTTIKAWNNQYSQLEFQQLLYIEQDRQLWHTFELDLKQYIGNKNKNDTEDIDKNSKEFTDSSITSLPISKNNND